MLTAAFLSMLLAAGPAAADVKVEIGRGKFDALPQLTLERPLPTSDMVARVERILASGKCRNLGVKPTAFDITVPYAIQLNPDGTTSHVIVGDRGCPEIETLVGQAVVQLVGMGDYKGKGASTTRWYGGEINFTLE